MGLTSYWKPGQSNTTRSASRFRGPSFSTGRSSSRFEPRGIPERIDVSDPILQAVETGARAPAYVYERPMAYLEEILGQDRDGRSKIDEIVEGVRDIPVVGEHISNLGDVTSQAFEHSWNLLPSIWNSVYAGALDSYHGKPDTDPVDPFWDPVGALTGRTVGDYRREAWRRGFTPEDAEAMHRGEKGWLDFGEVNMYDPENTPFHEVEEFGTRMAIDPLTWGPFAVAKISRSERGLRALLRLQEDGARATKHITATKPLGVRDGISSIVNGTWQGVTARSLAEFTHGWVRGSGAVFRGYRNLSLGLTGAQVAANAIDEIIPDEWSSEFPIMEEVFQSFRRIGENKPLSDNQLFQLWSIFHFPARDLLSQSYARVRKGKVALSRNDHILRVTQELGEEGVRALGGRGSDSFNAMMAQVLRVAIQRKLWRQSLASNRALEKFWGSSMAELGHHFSGLNARMAREMRRVLDEGSISGQEMVDAMRSMFAGRGDIVEGVTGGLLRQRWDPQRFVRTWQEWEPFAAKIDDVFEGGQVIVPGVSEEVVTKSQIDWIIAQLDDAARGTDKVAAKDVEEILMTAPALFGFDEAGLFTRTLTRSATEQELPALKRLLQKIRQEHAWDAEEWLADAKSWEEAAGRAELRRLDANRQIAKDGTLLDDVNPEFGNTQIVVPTAKFAKGSRVRAATGDTVSQLQTLRARQGTEFAEREIPRALRDAGNGVDSSIRVGLIDGNVARPGLVMKVDPDVDFQSLAEIAAHTLDSTDAERAAVLLTGDAVKSHGVPPNAAEFRWELGRVSPERLDSVVKNLRRQFGDRVMFNDSTGTLRVIIRDTDTKYATSLEKRLQKIVDDVGSEPARQPAFVQDVVKKAKKTDVPGTRTVASVEEIGRRSFRWHNTRDIIRTRRDGFSTDARLARERGPGGPGPTGPTPDEVLSRGVGPDDIPRVRRATRWERDSGRGPDARRESAGERSVDPGELGEYRGRVRDAVAGNARSGRVTVPADAELFATADRHTGAFVTNSGRLHIWHKPGTQFGDDWGAVLADASDAATWTVVPDLRPRRGSHVIDQLAEHGWRPVAKTEDNMVYLVRDVDGVTGSIEIPVRAHGQGGWTSVKNDVPTWSDNQARTTVRALRSQYLGELGPRQPGEPIRVRVSNDDIPTNPPEVTPDPELNAAVERKFERLSEIDRQIDELKKTGGRSKVDPITDPGYDWEGALLAARRANPADGLWNNAAFGRWVIDELSQGKAGPNKVASLRDQLRRLQDEAAAAGGPKPKARVQQGPLKSPNKSTRVRALQAERNEIAAGVRDAEFGIIERTGFSDDVERAAQSKIEVDLTAAPSGERTAKVLDISEGMGIKFGVVGWGESVASYSPWGNRVSLGPLFPWADDARAAEILTHEVGHHLRYRADAQLPKVFGDWVPEGTTIPGHGRPVKNREVFAINKADGGVEYTFNDNEAFADAFADYVSGRPVATGVAEYFDGLRGPARREIAPSSPVAPGPHPGDVPVHLGDTMAMPDDVDAVTFLWDMDEEIAAFHPRFDPSISENLDPAELQKVFFLEAEIKRFNPQYELKLAPRTATPYYRDQGPAYRAMMAGRRMAEDDWINKVTGPLARAQHLLLDPVFARELSLQNRQEVYNQFLNAGATRSEVDRFIRALQLEWDSQKFLTPRLGVHTFKSPAALPANQIDSIASGVKPVADFKGFDVKVLNELNRRGVMPHEMVRAAGSRTYRNLAKKFPAQDGKGSLGGIIDQVYGLAPSAPVAGAVFAGARGGSHILKTMYHMFRFLMDPRWYLLNRFEADILGGARVGLRATELRGTRQVDPVARKFITESRAVKAHQSRFGSEFLGVEDILHSDAMAAGWLDTRKLGGYVGAVFDAERPETTIKALRALVDSGDPILQDLRRKFGINTDDWIKGLDDLLYDIDTKGARAAVIDEAAELVRRRELVWNEVPKNVGDELFTEFLDRLYRAHQKNFQDVLHMFHGNVNRSNLERLVNSPLLYWPISYQLKAGKWLVDLLTDRIVGVRTDLLGTWTLDRVLKRHWDEYESDPEYRQMWDDHPALWRTLGMMVPVTPFDLGVMASRWSRWSGSWVGAQLGLWDQDPSYPQDPVNFIQRSFQLGPNYSIDLLKDIFDEIE